MLELILIETDDLRPQLQEKISVADNAMDADLSRMMIRMYRAFGLDPRDIRDELLMEFPLECDVDLGAPERDLDENVDTDFTGDFGADYLGSFSTPNQKSLLASRPCVFCVEQCEDTACLLRERSEE